MFASATWNVCMYVVIFAFVLDRVSKEQWREEVKTGGVLPFFVELLYYSFMDGFFELFFNVDLAI